MSTKLDGRLLAALARTKIAWWAIMLASTAGVLFYLPWWYVILLLPFGIALAFVLMWMTVNILAWRISSSEIIAADAELEQEKLDNAKNAAVEDIARRQAAGEVISPEEVTKALDAAGIISLVTVDEIGPVIARYMDTDIYEYITVKIPGHDTIDKLMYHGPAQMIQGVAEIPVIKGWVFANVNNILYSKDSNADVVQRD
jgi:predicted transcriptional regulator